MRVPGAYKWFVVAMLWCGCFLNYADRQLLFTVFPLIGAEFRLTDAALSVLSASFMCAYALFGPVAGFICDRADRRNVVLGALVLWSATVAASNLWAALYDVIPIERRGAALGIMNSLGWLGGAIAQLCIGLASDRFGMNICLSATALVYLGIAILMALGAHRLTRQTAAAN